jgi:rod shape determining protein RodA
MNTRGLDYRLLLISVFIFCIGIICLYSITYPKGTDAQDGLVRKQILWMVLSIIMFFLSFALGYQKFLELSLLFYLLILILLLLMPIIAPVVSGAQRWIRILGLNFQPAEFAKLSLILYLARYFTVRKEEINKFRVFSTAFISLAIYTFLIFQQPDLGSAMILIPIFFVIIVFARIKKKYIIGLVTMGFISLPFLWFILKDYQKERLLVFLNPNADPLGAGYTIIQSKIAIGSGGLFGKGLLQGSQSQFSFLPEGHTDFIFSLLCEEWGFTGAVVVILLYYLLIKRILEIAVMTNNLSAKLISLGIATLIFSHVFVNIGMVMGLMPVVGIPLPFISYGGSNLMANMFALGLVASIRKDL